MFSIHYLIRTNILILTKNLRTSLEQSQTYFPAEYRKKVFRLTILKISRTKH